MAAYASSLWRRRLVLASAAVSVTSLHCIRESKSEKAESESVYSIAEVARHQSEEDRIWVTFQGGVYDITEFVQRHPGGDKILLAAGKPLEPFWKLYESFHLKPSTLKLLEPMRIGRLREEDVEAASATSSDDPYVADPRNERHPGFYVIAERPFDCGVPDELLDSCITPTSLFYIRNHLPVPTIDPAEYKLQVCVRAAQSPKPPSSSPPPPPQQQQQQHTTTPQHPASPAGGDAGGGCLRCVGFTLPQLRASFGEVSVTATMQCSGNRRDDMAAAVGAEASGWGQGQVSTAVWTGVALSDVLREAVARLEEEGEVGGGSSEHGSCAAGSCGATDERRAFSWLLHRRNNCDGTSGKQAPPQFTAGHLEMEGLDCDEQGVPYRVSIPLAVAAEERQQVLLAYSMNGQPLPRDHGFPLRVVVPGMVGARQVKWVGRITAQPQECDSVYQRQQYRIVPPYPCTSPGSGSQTSGSGRSSGSGALPPAAYEWPVTSAVLSPPQGTVVAPGEAVSVTGWAYSGGGRGIQRVDISVDGGSTWAPAENRCCGGCCGCTPQQQPQSQSQRQPYHQQQQRGQRESNSAGVVERQGGDTSQQVFAAEQPSRTRQSPRQQQEGDAAEEEEEEGKEGDVLVPLPQCAQPPWGQRWAWTRWEATVTVPLDAADGSAFEVCACAVDDAFNRQPQSGRQVWNEKGYLCSCWPRLRCVVQRDDGQCSS